MKNNTHVTRHAQREIANKLRVYKRHPERHADLIALLQMKQDELAYQ